jgi:lipopolysaccharide/colanic/teichoic acid biosynthesis glycosyltransferase
LQRSLDPRTPSPPPLDIEMVFSENLAYRVVRRILDIVVASLCLALFALVLVLAAVAIYHDDPGPVIFSQRRVGRFERPFTIFKLRTMRKAACGDRASPTDGRDPRITAVGYWLRKTSIDELPQLVNVLLGEMTLVGPRPEMPFIVERYERWQHLRHLARPGITGLWQVECRSRIPLDRPEATLLDLHYIRHLSVWTDLAILTRTVRVVLHAEGAY